MLHLSDNLLRNERRGQGREGGDQHKDHREVFRGGGRLLNHQMKTGLDCMSTHSNLASSIGPKFVSWWMSRREIRRMKLASTSRGGGGGCQIGELLSWRRMAKRGRRKRRLFFLKIRWEGFKAATTSLILPWFLKMECLKKLTERLWQPPSPQTS